MAAVAAGAHAVGAPLTSSMMETAVVAGGIKSAAMAIAGLLVLAPVNAAFIFLPALFAISIGTNVLLVAVIADRVLGESEFIQASQCHFDPKAPRLIVTKEKLNSIVVPTALLGAAAVASIPLSFCLIYYYGGMRGPIAQSVMSLTESFRFPRTYHFHLNCYRRPGRIHVCENGRESR